MSQQQEGTFWMKNKIIVVTAIHYVLFWAVMPNTKDKRSYFIINRVYIKDGNI